MFAVEDFEFLLKSMSFPPDWTAEHISAYLLEHLPLTPKELGCISLTFFAHYYLSSHFWAALSSAHYEIFRECENLTGGKRALVLFPREHGKTTSANFAHVVWRICSGSKRNIGIFSDEQKQAKEFLKNIKTELTLNELIKQDFGDLRGNPKTGGKWDETHIITSNGIQVQIRTPGMAVRGMNFNATVVDRHPKTGELITRQELRRPDLFILDDILNAKTIRNREIRDNLDSWLFKDVLNALDKHRGDLLIIGTILHSDDLLSRCYKDVNRTQLWHKLRKPACEFGTNGEITSVLWKEYWSVAALEQRRVEIGSLAFAQEFLLNPVDEGAVFFKSDWFQFFADDDLDPDSWNSLSAWFGARLARLPTDLLLITSIDPNIKDKDTADYTVVLTTGWSPTTRCYYVVDAYRGRPSPEQQCLEMIRQKFKWDRELEPQRHGYKHRGFYHLGFVVETYAYQYSISSWLKKLSGLHGIPYVRVYEREEQGVDKTLRCSEMSPMAEQKRLYFPVSVRKEQGTGRRLLFHPMMWLEDELSEFGQGDSHDDGVDALQRGYSVLKLEERKYGPTHEGQLSEVDRWVARLKEASGASVHDIYANA